MNKRSRAPRGPLPPPHVPPPCKVPSLRLRADRMLGRQIRPGARRRDKARPPGQAGQALPELPGVCCPGPPHSLTCSPLLAPRSSRFPLLAPTSGGLSTLLPPVSRLHILRAYTAADSCSFRGPLKASAWSLPVTSSAVPTPGPRLPIGALPDRHAGRSFVTDGRTDVR